MKTIGNKEEFAFEISDKKNVDMRVVNIWLGGRSLCCDDNTVYVPQFLADLERFLSIKRDLRKFDKHLKILSPEEAHKFILSTRCENSDNFDIENDEIYSTHQFMDWGPTTDNISSFILSIDDDIYITYSFWREEHFDPSEIGKVYIVKINIEDIKKIIKKTVLLLRGA